MQRLNSLRDPKTGRFQTTTDTSRYKMVQFNGKRMSDHSRAFCIALNIPQIPKGFVVHHLDENKRNNDIDNLALVTITAHNRIHAHEAWNKGITKENSEVWKNAVMKQREAREETFLKKARDTYNIWKSTGKTQMEISKELNVNRATVSARIKRYNKYLKDKKNEQRN